jgi:hypothetical protein
VAATVGGVVLGAVLLVGALAKVIDPAAFAELIAHEGLDFLLPAGVVALLAIALEVGLGVALVSGLRRTWVMAVATGLVVFFLFLTGRAYVQYVRGEVDASHSCGCFGALVDRTPTQAFWTDVLLLVPALVLAWFERPAGEGWALPRRRGIAAGSAAVGAVVFALVAPSLPLDAIATKLSVGRRVDEICVGKEPKPACLRDALPLLVEGRNVVVLADLEDPGFRGQVEALNRYAIDAVGPRLWVVTAAREDEVKHFTNSAGATFDVFRAEGRLVRSLYRRLPRSFLVEDGVVTTTWDGLPPLDSLASNPR